MSCIVWKDWCCWLLCFVASWWMIGCSVLLLITNVEETITISILILLASSLNLLRFDYCLKYLIVNLHFFFIFTVPLCVSVFAVREPEIKRQGNLFLEFALLIVCLVSEVMRFDNDGRTEPDHNPITMDMWLFVDNCCRWLLFGLMLCLLFYLWLGLFSPFDFSLLTRIEFLLLFLKQICNNPALWAWAFLLLFSLIATIVLQRKKNRLVLVPHACEQYVD